MSRFRFLGALAPAALALGLLAAGASAAAADLAEGFEVVVPAGWFQGEPDEFGAKAGPPASSANTWAEFTSTITGLSGPTHGAVAFRYFVTDGGSGADSSYSVSTR